MVTKTDKYETKPNANKEQRDAESRFMVIPFRKYPLTINQRSLEGAGKLMYKQRYLVWLVRSSAIGTFHVFFPRMSELFKMSISSQMRSILEIKAEK